MLQSQWIQELFLFQGYLKSDNKTNGVFSEDGWFYTGDLGYFDADNELFIVDRKKDIIKYQCYHISPSDIEQLIEKSVDIEAIVVVGIPDPTAEDMHLPAALVIKSAQNPTITEEEISKLVEGIIESMNYNISILIRNVFFFLIAQRT